MKEKKQKHKRAKWRSIKRTRHYDPDVMKKTPKVRITTFVDADVLSILKFEATKNEEECQALLNRVLRIELDGDE